MLRKKAQEQRQKKEREMGREKKREKREIRERQRVGKDREKILPQDYCRAEKLTVFAQ